MRFMLKKILKARSKKFHEKLIAAFQNRPNRRVGKNRPRNVDVAATIVKKSSERAIQAAVERTKIQNKYSSPAKEEGETTKLLVPKVGPKLMDPDSGTL